MVICNIVHTDLALDGVISKYLDAPCVNIVTDITHLKTEVPTIFYGLECAKSHFKDVDRHNTKISGSYWWTYSEEEIPHENWIDQFVDESIKNAFRFVDNGIDVVFHEFELSDFTYMLEDWPLIHEGNHEIYVAEWNKGNIIISSVQKDTLKYVGIDPDVFFYDLCEKVEEFVSFETDRFNMMSNLNPIFLDTLLYANNGEWMGIQQLSTFYRNIVAMDRKHLIVYYLKQTECYRPQFTMYR